MNGLPYYKAYPRDFIEGTVGMSFELKAAYRLVLDLVYMQGGDLPDNSRYIAGLLGCSCGCETGPFEIDHVKPWSSGGQHTFENLVVSCRPCNRSKGAKSLDEWEGRVQ